MNRKFKIGDIVRRINEHAIDGFEIGDIAEVIGYEDDQVQCLNEGIKKSCKKQGYYSSYEGNLVLVSKLEKALL